MRVTRTAGAIIALALAAPLATSTHTIRRGETLSTIARQHGTTVAALAAANGISDPHRIIAGRVLTIGGGPPVAAAAAPAGTRHTVARGETLSHVARRYGTSVSALAAANGISDPNRVIAGTTLRVPGAGGAPTGSPSAPAGASHTVAAGEHLGAIAARYGVSTLDLARHNGIANPNLVRIGQRLQIPGGSPPAPTPGAYPKRILQNPDRAALIPVFDRWASHYGVPNDLLKAMTYLESGWQNHVVSSTGARGIGQLMPATVDFVSRVLIGTPLDPGVPEHNIRMSARFLKYLLDQNGGDASLALASYYQGLRAVRERGIYPQTHAYVAGVLGFRDRFAWS